jgi:hypothetical protein
VKAMYITVNHFMEVVTEFGRATEVRFLYKQFL